MSSSSSASSTPKFIGAKRLPPWELPAIPQVPHMLDSAPPLSTTERDALTSLWATRANSVTPPRATMEDDMSQTLPSVAQGSSWFEHEAWMAHEFENLHGSTLTPPASNEYQHAPVTHERSKRPTIALPGTMSSRSSTGQSQIKPSRKVPERRQNKRGQKQRKDHAALGHRLTTAVKGLFRKEPIDETQLESIEDRHWSED